FSAQGCEKQVASASSLQARKARTQNVRQEIGSRFGGMGPVFHRAHSFWFCLCPLGTRQRSDFRDRCFRGGIVAGQVYIEIAAIFHEPPTFKKRKKAGSS